MLGLLILGTLGSLANAQNPVSLSMSVTPASVPAGGSGTAKITANIEGGWYMYSISQGPGGPIPTRITVGDGPFKLAGVSGPKPKTKMDANFGINTESYAGSAVFNLKFNAPADTPAGPQTLNASVRYQVCNDSVCLPPKTVKLASAVAVTAGKAAASPTPTPSVTPTPTPNNSNANVNANANTLLVANTDEDANANGTGEFYDFSDSANTAAAQVETAAGPAVRSAESSLNDQPIWGFIWLAMTFGALSLLTPCVFPMIPITVSYFTKHGSESTAGSVRDALIYALGIV